MTEIEDRQGAHTTDNHVHTLKNTKFNKIADQNRNKQNNTITFYF